MQGSSRAKKITAAAADLDETASAVPAVPTLSPRPSAKKFSVPALDEPVVVALVANQGLQRTSSVSSAGGSERSSRRRNGSREATGGKLDQSHHSRGEPLDENALLCQQAGQLLARGDSNRAYDLYCEVLARDSYNVKALSGLAVLNHKRGMFDLARQLYQRCLRADPTRCKTAFNLGRLEHECKNYKAALELYRVTHEMAPDKETACSALAYEGLLQQEVFGDFQEASRLYEACLARDPGHIRTLDHKSALLLRFGEHEAAKELHQRVRALDPMHDCTWCPYTSCLFTGELMLPAKKAQGSRSELRSSANVLMRRSNSDPGMAASDGAERSKRQQSSPSLSKMLKQFLRDVVS